MAILLKVLNNLADIKSVGCCTSRSELTHAYELIPTMPELRLLPLVQRFAEMLVEIPVFANTFGRG
jgi:hypothetical protein